MADTPVTEAEAEDVYSILVEFCGASPAGRYDFVLNQTHGFISEYRFSGNLGFGGKVWRTDARGRWRVSCYREDETPERIHNMALANEALLRLAEKYTQHDLENKYGRYVMVAIQEIAHPTTDPEDLQRRRDVMDNDIFKLELKLRQARAMRELYG